MTEETFKVGDKVRVLSGGYGKIMYGPTRSTYDTHTLFVVKQDDEEDRAFKSTDLEALPAFAIGDTVKMYDETEPVEIIGGPFKNRYHTWFAVRTEIGETTASEGDLTALPDPIKVGDKVRVTNDDGEHRFVGRIGMVVKLNSDASRLPYRVQFGDGRGSHGEENGHWNCVAVERVTDTYEYEGVVYDLTARYQDSDGDVWFFKRMPDGAIRGSCRSAGSTYEPDIHNFSETLEDAATTYGPLLKV
ncbi:phiSA1p31-related protein [Streptomyces sp. NPDC091212]|uniref:phiSA1p31-related protein n=1 Tax=Streptomyces sp. NPDC091212 TaxID=3155191 RepID=UPI00342CD310